MKFIIALSALLLISSNNGVHAFTAVHPSNSNSNSISNSNSNNHAMTMASSSSNTALFAESQNSASSSMDRRTALGTSAAAALALGVGTTLAMPGMAFAAGEEEAATVAAVAPSNIVVVAGATGQSGRRVMERLAEQKGLTVVGAVRNVDKATKSLQEESTVIRGAMIQKVESIDTSNVALKHLDVVKDSFDDIQSLLTGANALVIAIGFIPGNPLKMNQAAHDVDNVGTCQLIDAAKAAGVKKVVMISSILTNGRSWGQEKSPGFQITNAFGGVLDEKLVAENYLRKSGLDYTIVRPGGLKAKPPSGPLIVSGEDTLNSGEVSRDLVADVCVAALTDKKVSNKVLEIIEDDGKPPQVFNGLNM